MKSSRCFLIVDGYFFYYYYYYSFNTLSSSSSSLIMIGFFSCCCCSYLVNLCMDNLDFFFIFRYLLIIWSHTMANLDLFSKEKKSMTLYLNFFFFLKKEFEKFKFFFFLSSLLFSSVDRLNYWFLWKPGVCEFFLLIFFVRSFFREYYYHINLMVNDQVTNLWLRWWW